ncbi:MAG: tRNA (N6-isopentenyl adenosine(37)-C2)-methylthiotransferase MiaB [Pelagibacteraceae bacterium]|nr:tRNA (N6-isopentenyl adenosine(37)-C2)-methylthiotransferase MiaB [Pelagibacteraceae bacterium]
MSKNFYIKTFGCQMNEYDSNRIADLLQSIDLKRVDDEQLADYFIFNTCHIREKATQKVYSDIGKIKKIFRDKRSKPTFILAGCVAQAESSVVFEKSDFVDIVVGPQAYHKLPGIIQEHDQNREKICNTDLDVSEKFDTLNSYKNNFSKVSSFVTIQEGCDKFCKFCVVPYTRGPEFSRSADTIIKEVQNLVDYGTREVVLLGQNVSAYQHEDFNLAKLIKQIATIAKLERIRFTTSHPNDFDEELINIFKYEPKLMPQLHLPVQSGSNKILELMNRKHTREFYLDLISKFKSARSDIEFSSDFIVGYPGETEEDFEQTISLVEEVQFSNSYSFIYSQRPGTPAVDLDQISKPVAQKRLEKLQQVLFDLQLKSNASKINQKTKVLIENMTSTANQFFGRNEYMQPVFINANNCIIGNVIDVSIHSYKRNNLFGTII